MSLVLWVPGAHLKAELKYTGWGEHYIPAHYGTITLQECPPLILTDPYCQSLTERTKAYEPET